MSAPPPPPGGVDMTFLYQLIVRVDDKLDQFIDRFVPRQELDQRLGALEKQLDESQIDQRDLQAQLDGLAERRKQDLQWLMGFLLLLIGTVLGVVTLIYK